MCHIPRLTGWPVLLYFWVIYFLFINKKANNNMEPLGLNLAVAWDSKSLSTTQPFKYHVWWNYKMLQSLQMKQKKNSIFASIWKFLFSLPQLHIWWKQRWHRFLILTKVVGFILLFVFYFLPSVFMTFEAQ